MTESDPELVTVTVTCHTNGCGNADAPIELQVPADVGGFVCGVCGQTIEDVAS